MILMTGEELSNKINFELKQQVKGYMIKPCLAIIQIGDSPISEELVKFKLKASEEVGVYLKHIHFSEDTKEIEIVNKIVELNNDDYVNGITIQMPIPEKFNKERLINYIVRNKDVDGLTDLNLGKVFNNKKAYVPSIAQAVLEMCKFYNIELVGKQVVIINRSSLVGKPLAGLLINSDATVTICHSKTVGLENIVKNADVIISAVGIPNFINADMLKDNVMIFDIGLSLNENELVGDMDLKNIENRVTYLATSTNGINVLAASLLLKSVVDSYQKMNENK